jgi:hypothetical protein
VAAPGATGPLAASALAEALDRRLRAGIGCALAHAPFIAQDGPLIEPKELVEFGLPVFQEHLPPPSPIIPDFQSLVASDEAMYDYLAWIYYWWKGWLRAPAS